jgi:hypothetical protein
VGSEMCIRDRATSAKAGKTVIFVQHVEAYAENQNHQI